MEISKFKYYEYVKKNRKYADVDWIFEKNKIKNS